MKCIYCGKELQPDNVFCPHCGKAAQIVPDYSMYDDDYLKEVLTQENTLQSAKPSQKHRQQGPGRDVTNNNRNNQQRQKGQGGASSDQSQNSSQREKEQKKKKVKIAAGIIGTGFVLIFAILVLFAAIRSNHNNSFDYQMKLAEKATLKGDLDQAVSYYERAVELDPGSVDAKMALADIYMKKKDYDSAEPLYKVIIADDKKNRNAFKNLISIYESEEKTDKVMALSVMADESLSDLFSDYQTDTPVFSLQSGTYDTPQMLELRSPKGYAIFYTMDGSDPRAKGARYSGPIELSENNRIYTIKAVCQNEKNINSEVVTKNYRIEIKAPDMPSVSPDGGNFETPVSVTVSVPNGCSAYYTWDGSTPNTGSSRYSGSIEVPEGNNILSVIVYDRSTGQSSQVYRGNFIYYAQDTPQENEGEAQAQQEAEEEN